MTDETYKMVWADRYRTLRARHIAERHIANMKGHPYVTGKHYSTHIALKEHMKDIHTFWGGETQEEKTIRLGDPIRTKYPARLHGALDVDRKPVIPRRITTHVFIEDDIAKMIMKRGKDY